MFDLFKRYADEGYMKFDKGYIWFGKEMISLYFVLYSAGEIALNSRISGWRYLASKFIVSRKEGRALIQQHGARDMNELSSIVKVVLTVMNIFGMGTFKVIEADGKRGLAVLSGVSTLGLEVKSDRPMDTPVDFVIGGLLAGAVGQYTKRQAYAVEISCVSQKDADGCTWIAGDRPSIIAYIKEAFPSKEELGNRTLDEIESVEKELKGKSKLQDFI